MLGKIFGAFFVRNFVAWKKSFVQTSFCRCATLKQTTHHNFAIASSVHNLPGHFLVAFEGQTHLFLEIGCFAGHPILHSWVLHVYPRQRLNELVSVPWRVNPLPWLSTSRTSKNVRTIHRHMRPPSIVETSPSYRPQTRKYILHSGAQNQNTFPYYHFICWWIFCGIPGFSFFYVWIVLK